MKGKFLAILACVGILGFGLAGSSSASPGDGPYQGGSYFIDGTLGTSDIYPPAIDWLRSNPANSVWTSSLNNYIVTKDKLHPSVAHALDFGTVDDGNVAEFPGIPMDKIGGPFATNATNLGTFVVQPGTWNLFHNATFERTVTGVPGTRMQIALRAGTEDYGTTMGNDISPTKGRELVESGVQIITVDNPTVVTVWAFGYNDDTSNAGSGQITASARIWLERVGD